MQGSRMKPDRRHIFTSSYTRSRSAQGPQGRASAPPGRAPGWAARSGVRSQAYSGGGKFALSFRDSKNIAGAALKLGLAAHSRRPSDRRERRMTRLKAQKSVTVSIDHSEHAEWRTVLVPSPRTVPHLRDAR